MTLLAEITGAFRNSLTSLTVDVLVSSVSCNSFGTSTAPEVEVRGLNEPFNSLSQDPRTWRPRNTVIPRCEEGSARGHLPRGHPPRCRPPRGPPPLYPTVRSSGIRLPTVGPPHLHPNHLSPIPMIPILFPNPNLAESESSSGSGPCGCGPCSLVKSLDWPSSGSIRFFSTATLSLVISTTLTCTSCMSPIAMGAANEVDDGMDKQEPGGYPIPSHFCGMCGVD